MESNEIALALKALGEDFEKHGGVRPFAFSYYMDEEWPVDCMGYYTENYLEMVDGDEEVATQGFQDWDGFKDFAGACWDLRMHYNVHEAWIDKGLFDYFRHVRGFNDADSTAMRDRYLTPARAAFDKLLLEHELRRRIKRAQHTLANLPKLVDSIKEQIESVQQAIETLYPETRAITA